MSQNVISLPASGNGGTSRADSRKAELLAALEAQKRASLRADTAD